MALPKISNYPTKKITLPISNKKITIRPFVVKEEKILIMVRENEESTSKDYLNAMCQVVESCTTENVSAQDLCEADLSYIFLQVRMLAKGETSKVSYRCKAQTDDGTCDTPLDINLDLNQVEAYTPEDFQDLFQVPNHDVYLKLKVPTVGDAAELEELGVTINNLNAAKWNDIETIIAICVESVIEGDEQDSTVNSDFTREELVEWFEGLPDSVLEDIVLKFLGKLPYLRYPVDITCPACGTNHKFEIVGLENFFE
jgi:hypothetical protein